VRLRSLLAIHSETLSQKMEKEKGRERIGREEKGKD
jgi:hypothetical protein